MIWQIQEESRLLGRQIKELETKLRKAPDGELRCARNGNGVKWYYYGDTAGRAYLPKKNRTLAQKLALKKFNKTSLEAARKKKAAIDACIAAYAESSKVIESLTENDSCYRELLLPQLSRLPEHVADWAQEEYERNEDHPEILRFSTKKGDLVRSKSEVFIADTLFFNKIPYRYESKLDLGSFGIYYPDFVVYHPRLLRIYYWEHFGRMDDEEYAHKAYRKLEIYTRNGIIPMDNLLMTFETKARPLDPASTITLQDSSLHSRPVSNTIAPTI